MHWRAGPRQTRGQTFCCACMHVPTRLLPHFSWMQCPPDPSCEQCNSEDTTKCDRCSVGYYQDRTTGNICTRVSEHRGRGWGKGIGWGAFACYSETCANLCFYGTLRDAGRPARPTASCFLHSTQVCSPCHAPHPTPPHLCHVAVCRASLHKLSKFGMLLLKV